MSSAPKPMSGPSRAGAILLALVSANLGRAFPRTGGPYAYARRAFGDFIGFQTAWATGSLSGPGNAAIAVAFVGYLAVFSCFGALNGWILLQGRVLLAG